jgi:DNA-binding NtrC family response regulator
VAEGDVASAAEVLGVSRQSLYMKLKRYGLGADVDASVEGSSTRGRKITPKG